tara:strand:- start:357 stop:4736 length:4380 start_codon:yes stop_codon:yes gene_type:complete
MLLLCLWVTGESTAAERTLARMGELRASVDTQNWCGPVVQVDVEAPLGTQLDASARQLQLLIGGVRQILNFECPGVQVLELTGFVGGQVVGRWRHRGDGQLVSMVPPPTSGSVATPASPTRPSGPPSKAQVAQAQSVLSELGYQPGPADGLMGQRTRNAIAAFTRDRQLPRTNAVNDDVLAQLRRARCENLGSCEPATGVGLSQAPGAQPSPASGAPAVSSTVAIPSAVAAMPVPRVPTAPATTTLDANGNEAVQAALLGWALGRHPDLTTSGRLQLASWQLKGLPGATAPAKPGNGPESEAFLKAVSDAAKTMPAPEKIRIEIPAALYGQGEELRLSSQTEEIAGVAALVRVYLQWPQIDAAFEWKEQKPFYLPLPADLTVPVRKRRNNKVKDKILLSIVLEMSNPVANVVPGYAHLRSVSADAQIETVDLVHRIERLNAGTYVADPDRVLASWTRQDAASTAPALAAPADVDDVVALFGGAKIEGRYAPEWNSVAYQGSAIDVSRGQFTHGSPGSALETAFRFGAILAAGGERTLGPEAVQLALRTVVTEREAYDLFPAQYLKNPREMNELERRAAIRDAEPKLREILAARVPDLPLKVRDVHIAGLGEYDFELQRFPLHKSGGGTWGPEDPITGAPMDNLIPSFLTLSENDAVALLKTLEARQMRRMLFAAVDFTITEAVTRPGRQGPIEPAELNLVRVKSVVDAVTLYSDSDMTQTVAVIPVSAQQEAPKPLPDEVYATTGKSLLAAIGKMPDGRSLVLQTVNQSREIGQVPADQRASRARAITDQVIATARDNYWVGASWNLGPYSEAEGGFPIKKVALYPVPHNQDISGFAAPGLKPDQDYDYQVLRVDPVERAAVERYLDQSRAKSIQGMSLSSIIRVRPVGVSAKRGTQTLTVSAPIEMLLGDHRRSHWPQTEDARINLTPTPLARVSDSGVPDVEPPDVLMLDHEGIDLLAISLNEEAYGPSAYKRMLLERLLKERTRDADELRTMKPGSIDWGQFFPTPDAVLPQAQMLNLLPVFKAWTLARSAQLPSRVAIPLSFGNRANPDTGCMGGDAVIAALAGSQRISVYDRAAGLLGGQLPETNFVGSNRLSPRPGEDRIWALMGRPSIGGKSECRYMSALKGKKNDLPDVSDSDYADALIRIIAQPTLQSGSSFTAATYIGEIETAKFATVAPSAADGRGLVGAVIVTVTPIAAQGFRQENSGKLVTFDPLEPIDWALPEADPPDALDIVGLTLGTPLKEFVASAMQRMPQSKRFLPEAPIEGIFGAARGLFDPETREGIAAVYAAGVEGRPVVAIMRRLEVPTKKASVKAIRKSLEQKYGTPSEVSPDGVHMIWGNLPQIEDGRGFCGGMRTLGSPDSDAAPRLRPESGASENRQNEPRPEFWTELGWPRDGRGHPAASRPDLERCGPVVAASVMATPEKSYMVVWLFDRKLAEIQRSAPKVEEEAADIDL